MKLASGALKIAERRAVNVWMMTGTPARLAASRPRMPALPLCVWTMSGFCSRRIFSSLRKREQIFQRMNGPDEFGNDGEQFRRIFEDFGFQRAFRAGGRAGNQIDFDAGFLAQAEDGGDGVFLRAADDQPGDDVGDAHRRGSG